MKIAIVAAMPEEVQYFIEKIDNITTSEINNFTFNSGKLYHHDVVLVVSGIGKVFAGVLLTTLFNNFEVDLVINVGVAGGLIGKTKLGNVVIGEKLFYGDVNLAGNDKYSYGQLPKCPPYFTAKNFEFDNKFNFDIQKGDIITSDTFVNELSLILPIITKHFNDQNILACDMETTAFAQTCYFFKKDFIVIRGISDIVGRKDEDLAFNDDNLMQASLHSCLVLEDFLKNL